MKRLLKIREFFHLKKRDLKEQSESGKPAKRPRKAFKKDDHECCTVASASSRSASPRSNSSYNRFIELFESEVAKDVLWWLPGRRGEAFAMNRERFELDLMKKHFEGYSFAGFRENLDRWGFRQMNIPSLSGRVLTFEKGSQGTIGQQQDGGDSSSSRPGHNRNFNDHLQQIVYGNRLALHSLVGGTTPQVEAGTTNSEAAAHITSLQYQQAQYIVQQEMTQTYFALLWQELQRQLSVLFLIQSQAPAASDDSNPAQTASFRSEIADVASLLHQHQIQQQVTAAQFYQAAIAEPTRIATADPQTVVRELNELHQQQLSNLTYQIVALVAAGLEQQNQNPVAPEPPVFHKIMVKYLLALVLLQLQQQQHNLEFLRHEKMNALALIRSFRRASASTTSTNGQASRVPQGQPSTTPQDQPTTAPGEQPSTTPAEQPSNDLGDESSEPIRSMQMPHMLAEAAMLSLSRAHQLLAEAAVLIPHTIHWQPEQTGFSRDGASPAGNHPASERHFSATTGLSSGTPAPRTTTAQ